MLALLFSLLDACGIFVDVFQLYGGVFSIDTIFSAFFLSPELMLSLV